MIRLPKWALQSFWPSLEEIKFMNKVSAWMLPWPATCNTDNVKNNLSYVPKTLSAFFQLRAQGKSMAIQFITELKGLTMHLKSDTCSGNEETLGLPSATKNRRELDSEAEGLGLSPTLTLTMNHKNCSYLSWSCSICKTQANPSSSPWHINLRIKWHILKKLF